MLWDYEIIVGEYLWNTNLDIVLDFLVLHIGF